MFYNMRNTYILTHKAHCFCIFLIFQFFFYFYMRNKTKQKKKKINNNNKNMLNNQSIKTRLTQNLKAKHISNAHTKQEERERKVIESLGAIVLPHPGRTFPLIKPLNQW